MDQPLKRGATAGKSPARAKQPMASEAEGTGQNTVGLRLADRRGLLSGPKTQHISVNVSPALFAAAAKRIGTSSPEAVMTAALASLATEDDAGPWLARNWGALADIDPELLDQIDM